jgi:eukaryotic-like serine/threonine-protein kinase
VLDNVFPLLLLHDPAIKAELAVDSQNALAIVGALADFHSRRNVLTNQNVGSLTSVNEELTNLLHQLDRSVSQNLSELQLQRLHQIARQRRLPFTFKTAEVVAALELTRDQREAINRIIEETGPQRGPPHDRGARRGPPPPQAFAFDPGPPDDFNRPPQRDRLGFGPGGREMTLSGGDGPHRLQGGRGGGPPSPVNPRSFAEMISNTVYQITRVLTAAQLEKWNELIGQPYDAP